MYHVTVLSLVFGKRLLLLVKDDAQFYSSLQAFCLLLLHDLACSPVFNAFVYIICPHTCC